MLAASWGNEEELGFEGGRGALSAAAAHFTTSSSPSELSMLASTAGSHRLSSSIIAARPLLAWWALKCCVSLTHQVRPFDFSASTHRVTSRKNVKRTSSLLPMVYITADGLQACSVFG